MHLVFVEVLFHTCAGLPAELYPHVEESEYLVFIGVLLHACTALLVQACSEPPKGGGESAFGTQEA